MLFYYRKGCPECQKVLDYLEEMGKTLPMKNLQGNPAAEAELKNLGTHLSHPCLVVDPHLILVGSREINLWLQTHSGKLSNRPGRL